MGSTLLFAAAIIGAALLTYAVVGYPLLGYALGHRYPAAPTFGVPCPTTIFTLGLGVWAGASLPRRLLIAPLAWSIVGTSAAITLGMIEDLGLLAAAIATVVAASLGARTAGHRVAGSTRRVRERARSVVALAIEHHRAAGRHVARPWIYLTTRRIGSSLRACGPRLALVGVLTASDIFVRGRWPIRGRRRRAPARTGSDVWCGRGGGFGRS